MQALEALTMEQQTNQSALQSLLAATTTNLLGNITALQQELGDTQDVVQEQADNITASRVRIQVGDKGMLGVGIGYISVDLGPGDAQQRAADQNQRLCRSHSGTVYTCLLTSEM